MAAPSFNAKRHPASEVKSLLYGGDGPGELAAHVGKKMVSRGALAVAASVLPSRGGAARLAQFIEKYFS